jgi:hypothetical protein
MRQRRYRRRGFEQWLAHPLLGPLVRSTGLSPPFTHTGTPSRCLDKHRTITCRHMYGLDGRSESHQVRKTTSISKNYKQQNLHYGVMCQCRA